MGKTKLRKITKANITHISFVPKAANKQHFLIVKADDGALNWQMETPILKTDEEKRLVTGIVYEPDVVDTQGEFMEADAIEEAAHAFLVKHGATDIRHNFVTNEKVAIVESSVAKADYELDGVPIRKGTWTITAKIGDDALWEGIKQGEYTGFSMGGEGIREEVILEDGEVLKEDDTTASAAKEAAGFFAVVKNYFTSARGEAEKPQAEPLIKAGRTFSGANEAKIRAAYEALGGLLQETAEDKADENDEEAEIMKKEDIEAIIKETLAPLCAKVEALEKEETPIEAEGLTKEALDAILKEALAPMETRITQIEKARGLSRQASDEAIMIEKEEEPFNYVQI